MISLKLLSFSEMSISEKCESFQWRESFCDSAVLEHFPAKCAAVRRRKCDRCKPGFGPAVASAAIPYNTCQRNQILVDGDRDLTPCEIILIDPANHPQIDKAAIATFIDRLDNQ